MEALDLARAQFAVTTSLHFLFVVLTLGLAPLVALMQTRAVITGREIHERMTRFWGQIYVINYGLGIFTGLVQEFQFGLHWSGLAHYAGDVFGAPLAIETLGAFFLESTFLGLWIFGWHRLPKWAHLACIWIVTLTAYASAFWIMVANSFLQNPVGSELRGGKLVIVDFGALVTNPNLGMALGHTVGAGLWTASFVMIGVCAYHFIKRTAEQEFFLRSMRLAVWTGFLASLVTVGFGYAQFGVLGDTQPGKTDGVEGYLANMMTLGNLLTVISFLILPPLLIRGWIARRRILLGLLILCVPLPFIASILGWLVREIGRQPWLVYNKLTVADGVAHVSTASVTFSFIAFTTVLGLLALADYALIIRAARRGPGDVPLGARGGPGTSASAGTPALTL
ncbi:cytochrome ubiquinol oxidase subunit I [Rhizohabitans arisaemae]|uniref:cytochrome ubiquinol oxidase subunit I n=1 Tax=Rhizohabitans arisaemae TaxID=2720610 RepID=UPI0024B126C3|nr:cytochrome ubiquinol oxidase subunit I [Rhizohabitans arisaemae]